MKQSVRLISARSAGANSGEAFALPRPLRKSLEPIRRWDKAALCVRRFRSASYAEMHAYGLTPGALEACDIDSVTLRNDVATDCKELRPTFFVRIFPKQFPIRQPRRPVVIEFLWCRWALRRVSYTWLMMKIVASQFTTEFEIILRKYYERVPKIIYWAAHFKSIRKNNTAQKVTFQFTFMKTSQLRLDIVIFDMASNYVGHIEFEAN
jgi:hypothetical protein